VYRYDEFDQAFVEQRVEQFTGQIERRLSGALSEEEFKPLRLMNGVYLQLHAYMLRVAIPYGTLSSEQMRRLGDIARRYDKGYGHFTTRQNIQFNWPRLEDMPAILGDLAEVQMHAVQTSGNCIRNVTADHFAGAAADEIEDPRITSEIVRQWSSLHPEFSFLPRKFKIAVSGSAEDRAAVRVHDIGLELRRNDAGDVGYRVIVGGGQGRTPMIGATTRDFLPKRHLLSYLEAIMRVYNLFGRRDNKYKARIKILVHDLGAERFAELVEAEWQHTRHSATDIPVEEAERIAAYFAPPDLEMLATVDAGFSDHRASDPAFAAWVRTNVAAHRAPGYAIVTISLKPEGGIPGDATAEQMDAVADLAEAFSLGEIRVSHEQNLVLAHVRQSDLYELWRVLDIHGLATPNAGLISDIIACPGLDFCALANARSIPIAQSISRRFADLRRQHEIGPLKVKISGCVNACGHHHVGHIGVLGVDKKGEEFYQITLGGSADQTAALGTIVGPAFPGERVADAVETIVDTYLGMRQPDETFLESYRRVGIEPFKEALYAAA